MSETPKSGPATWLPMKKSSARHSKRPMKSLVRHSRRLGEMRRGANEFAEDVLKRTEETMAKHLGELRQARQVLRNPTRASSPSDEEDA